MGSTSEEYYQDMQKCRVNHSIPPIHEDNLRLWLQGAPKSWNYSGTEISCLEEYAINLYGVENAQSSNNHTIKPHGKESCEAVGEECKRQKRPRNSTQDHNLNERLRRKKLTEKLTALQEMIPNSVKKDQASTIDDAIKYIKTLQCQVQMMSGEAGHTLFHSPMTMVPPQLQGFLQVPNLAPLLPTGGNGMCNLGMSNLLSYPVGLTNPLFIPSPSVGLGLATTHHSMEPFDANNIPC